MKQYFRFGVIAVVSIMAILILSSLFVTGCTRSEVNENSDLTVPTREFKEKCDSAAAFRIYIDHNGKWACKLEDGRVLTEN